MRILAADGRSHPAILTTRHPDTGHGVPVVVLTDTKVVIDQFAWTFCRILTSSEEERDHLRAAGYHC